ncbi:unnamed protein product [Rotaria sordida]|uniref:Uncharacterized protein n=1 Tax=Rotaria sordida TaxID=392033 RepID=A0A814RF42_9BILA|nr:unnamed protein product [Rotaria sordida]CAF1501694.1 unnamed protein product [Rotaria sordida]CAF3989687.1 unnamed protein product [Rotaria sordida]CAF4038782.1 unnamed protein product [Rotaria sordida]
MHNTGANGIINKTEIYEKVGLYLSNNEMMAKQQVKSSNNYFPNSNKIGLGYNPAYGNPVCYTGSCQMEGFGQPIFELYYHSSSPGACTDKLIPNFVSLDCLPSSASSATTEVISTLKELSDSISNKVEVSVGGSYGAFSFSYTNSKETRYMVDNIVKSNMVSMYTSAEVSYAKLSMFEPLMELSSTFRYVIENLPCCDDTDDDWDTEKYIRDYVLNYYGYTFVSTLLLGGVAQQSIFMKNESYKKLESRGVSTKNAANAAFYVSVGVSVENSESNTQQQELMNEAQQSYSTKLGGDPSVVNIHEWATTVPSNSIIIKFGIREIFDLLNKRRFPNDSQIQNKSKLIEKVLKKYLQQPLYCYNDCTNASHGTCQSSGYFQFGTCVCNKNWTGNDCSIRVSSTKPSLVYGDVLSGTLCGYDRSYIRVNCNGYRPWNECPQGWIPQTWIGADFTVCYKSVTSKNSSSIVGGLCGLYSSGSKQFSQILCNNTLNNACPSLAGYSLAESSLTINGVFEYLTRLCHKSSSAYPDLPGTLCGIQWAQTTDGPACGGYNPGLSQCPPGYILQFWILDTGSRFNLCAKQ